MSQLLRKQGSTLRWSGLIVFVALVIAGCTTDGSPGENPSTPSTPPPTEAPIPDNCHAETPDQPFVIDLDDDGVEELVYVKASANASWALVVCIDEGHLELEITGENVVLAGFQDLDGDRTSEILFTRDGTRGPELGAATITLRGLRLTSLAIERWMADDGSADGIEGESFQCIDWHGDGASQLIHWRFRPADGEVSISADVVELVGLDAVEGGVDWYETDREEARDLWAAPDGCLPGETLVRDIRFSELGWAKVGLRPELFQDRDDIVLTAVAQAGDVLAAVGTEAPNLAVGNLVEAQPLAWWSLDGITWNQTQVEGEDAEMLDVAAFDGRFLAVGRAGTNPAVWNSDDGKDWKLSTIETTLEGGHGVMYTLVSSPHGLLAVGAEDYWDASGRQDTDAAIWTSEDGILWSRIQSPSLGTQGYQPNEGAEFNGSVFDVAYDRELGFVAIGYDSDADPVIDFPQQYPAVWTSSDAEKWERHRLDHDSRLTGIIRADGLFVTYGSTDRNASPTSDAVILTSSDGTTWETATGAFGALQGEDGIQSVNAIRQAPDGSWLALGAEEIELDSRGAVAVWSSTDLLDWDRIPNDADAFGVPDEVPSPFVTDAISTSQGLLIAVGSSGETVDLIGDNSVCCLYRPHIIVFDPAAKNP